MNKSSRKSASANQQSRFVSRIPTGGYCKPSLGLEQKQQLLSEIYDAALDESHWTEVIYKLSTRLKSERGAMRLLDSTQDEDVQQMYSYNRDTEWSKVYNDYYKAVDPWLNLFSGASHDLFLSTHQVLSNREYESMEFHADFIKPQKIHYGMGGIFQVSGKMNCYLSFQRDKNQSGFANGYVESVRALFPHIRKSLLINERTRSADFENNLLRDGLNQINSALVLVNKFGCILYINSVAEQLIEKQSGIDIKNNQILIRSNHENNKLYCLISQAARCESKQSFKQGGGMCFHNPVSQDVVSILVCPVNPGKTNNDTSADGCVLLLLGSNGQQSCISSELLKSLYNLTSAESRLVGYLCSGLTLDEIASLLGLSKNTLRTQLRASFHKTGVYRQAELVDLVNSGPAGVIRRLNL